MVPVSTPAGEFRVWTKRVGSNPGLTVLLNGGPGATSELYGDPLTRPHQPGNLRPMQGPSELGLSGSLEDWDRSASLPQIDVPTLVVGATHDTMDPAHMRWMAGQLPQGQYLHCPDGSHLAQFDDPSHYFPGLIGFLTAL